MALPLQALEQGAGQPPASAADPNLACSGPAGRPSLPPQSRPPARALSCLQLRALLAPPGAGGDTEEPERGDAAVALACPPDDALVEILSFVPIKSRCRFKCVSKAWRDLITDRLRCRAFPQTLEGFFYSNRDVRGVGGGHGDDDDIGGGHGHFIDLLGRSVPLIDSPFSFLLKHPRVKIIRFINSCHGLFLFGHRRWPSDTYNSLGYIVCNPATEQWVAVPSSGRNPPLPRLESKLDYVIFDPAVSQDFQLIQFVQDYKLVEVHAYSSKTRLWSGRGWCDGDANMNRYRGSAFLKGNLHLIVSVYVERKIHDVIIAFDAEGRTYRTIWWPMNRGSLAFVGQSQGHLYCMSEHSDVDTNELILSIWVLEDYDTEEWVMKHGLGLFQLFERTSSIYDDFIFSYDLGAKPIRPNYFVVAIHPDCNLVFFLQQWNRKLISYNMDSKDVCVLHTVRHGYLCITPYIPCLMESSALAKNGIPNNTNERLSEKNNTKERHEWLKNGMAGISKVKMAIQNYSTQVQLTRRGRHKDT
ncbi:hypothetical protein BS78_01G267400 [Paspalum vaginatum]|nr:hypothetical protein BS78_01G267400 [Paspalum vaginatum]